MNKGALLRGLVGVLAGIAAVIVLKAFFPTISPYLATAVGVTVALLIIPLSLQTRRKRSRPERNGRKGHQNED